MGRAQFTVRRMTIGGGGLACLAFFVVGVTVVSQVFGIRSAAVLSLLLAPALVVAVRLCRRWPAVHGRELVFLAVLFCVASGGIVFLVRGWYANGMDREHAEDVKWAEFEGLLRRDP